MKYRVGLEDSWSLWHEDCAETCERLEGDLCELIYLDPPFNSGREYHGRGAAKEAAFLDRCFGRRSSGQSIEGRAVVCSDAFSELQDLLERNGATRASMLYLDYMAQRLAQLHRVLAKNGSIYLHCDPHASHYLRIVMDRIFGPRNFRNEIIWQRTWSHNNARLYGNIHDTILYYSKSDDIIFNTQYTPYEQDYIDENYRYEDAAGRFCGINITAPGRVSSESGKPWQGISPGENRHWYIPRSGWSHCHLLPAGTHDALDYLKKTGRLYWRSKDLKSKPVFKKYIWEIGKKGVPLQDVFSDISPCRGKESTGYPTQKPQALLERIIESSSNEGDIFYDPFMGSGTSLAVAVALGRKAIGSDISEEACRITAGRLADIDSQQGRLFNGDSDRQLSPES